MTMFFRSFKTGVRLNQIFLRNFSKESLIDIGICSSLSGLVKRQTKHKKSERKPWVTNIDEIKRKSRLEKQERKIEHEATLKPPENGLLVKELIPVARQVFAARNRLLACAIGVAGSIPIFVCCVCGDVHVGDPPHKIRTCNVSGSKKNKEHTWARGGIDHVIPVVESFHLYDRLGRAVSHDERLAVDRIPAIVELCIQAGLDIPEYPTRRRDFPIYRVAGKMIDFEKRFPKIDLGKNINSSGFWLERKLSDNHHKALVLEQSGIKKLAKEGMKALENMQSGIGKLMHKYAVQTCGYCSEVQVGPKGHRVRQCQAFKHQMRDGQHDWQEATYDDLFPPVYVWHVPDAQNSLLVDALKEYYGKLPVVVELFAQAGAEVGENFWNVMKKDVAVPGLDEAKLVV